MSFPLHVGQRHDRHQAPQMEAVGCRVKSDVARGGPFQQSPYLLHIAGLFYETPFCKNI